MVPLSKAKQISFGSYSFGSDDSAFDKLFNKVQKFLTGKSDNQSANDLDIKSHLTLDFGFDYRTKCGFIIGMNGPGLALGYDVSKLVIKA